MCNKVSGLLLIVLRYITSKHLMGKVLGFNWVFFI